MSNKLGNVHHTEMKEKRIKPTENDKLILYSEVEGLCPICTTPIMYEKDGENFKQFEIAHIYPLNPTDNEKRILIHEERLTSDPDDLDNLICLCANCHTQFDKPRTIEGYRNLISKKKKFINQGKTKSIWGDAKIEKEINELIEILLKEDFELKKEDFLNYNPKTIDHKTNKTITPLTKRKIHRDVQDYYHIIKSKFIELDKLTPLTTETISSQIKTLYLSLCRQQGNEINQKDIFDALVNWLTKKTNQYSSDGAEIVIAYFIQNCEVFE